MKKIISFIIACGILVTSQQTCIGVICSAVESSGDAVEYVVETYDEESIEILQDSYDAEQVESLPGVYEIQLTERQAARLENDSDINIVEENIVFEGCETETEEENSISPVNQWYMQAIGVENAPIPENRVKVAIIDSGVDYSGEVCVTETKDFIYPDSEINPMFNDMTGHGTSIAGIISAKKDGVSIEGINPNTEIYSARILDAENQATLSRVIAAIYWSIEKDVDIINMSFGTSTNSELLHNAIIDAYNAGIVLVASAGNTEHKAVLYPAAYPQVISVGSVDGEGDISQVTSLDSNLDVFAPGEKIVSVNFLNYVTSLSGTSFATAQVTGIASLILGQHPDKSNSFTKDLICSCVKNTTGTLSTDAGIVDYANIVNSYDDFCALYDSGTIDESDFSDFQNYDYSDETEAIVEGLWLNEPSSGNGHYGLADEACINSGLSDGVDIIRTACIRSDSYKEECKDRGSTEKYGGLHGYGNYVLYLKFLFNISRCIYNYGVNSREYENMLSSFSVDNFSYEYNEKSYMVSIHNILNDLISYPKELLNGDTYENKTFTQQDIGFMILGVALHLAADVYAHRSIVPKYTIAGVNPKEDSYDNNDDIDMFGSDKFPQSDTFDISTAEKKEAVSSEVKAVCKKNGENETVKSWQHFQWGVAIQVVEFRDIGMFLKSSAKNTYEDYARFCNERYQASGLACNRLVDRFMKGNFYIKLFYPKCFKETDEITHTVVINNFEKYTDKANMERFGVNLTQEDWDTNSTRDLV